MNVLSFFYRPYRTVQVAWMLVLLLLVAGASLRLRAQVSTLAGNGTSGTADATGSAARFNLPRNLAIDAAGNAYIADAGNHRIRRVTPAGVVTTLAGSTQGFADGTGAGAQFDQPHDVVLDGSGNLYVADRFNHRIRKIVIGTGVVTTFAGDGTAGWIDATGTGARFNSPHGLCIDGSGNLYVADLINPRIRKITPGGVVTTIAGNGTAGFADGAAASAQFNDPADVEVDAVGNLYVADHANRRVRKITPGGFVSTLAGTGASGLVDGPGATAQFASVGSLCIDNLGNIYATDEGNHVIRRISPAGTVSTLAGTPPSGFIDGTFTAAKFFTPTGTAIDPTSGALLVCDHNNHAIRKIVAVTPTVTMFAPTSAYPMQVVTITGTNFFGVTQVQFGGVNAAWFEIVSNTQIRAVVPFGAAAGNVSVTNPAGAGNLAGFTVAATPQVSTLAGTPTTLGYQDAVGQASILNYPYFGVKIGNDIYFTDFGGHRVRKLNIPTGTVTTIAGSGTGGYLDATGTAAQFLGPAGIVTDGTNLYVGEWGNHTIRKIVIASGVVTTLAGMGGVSGYTDAAGTSAQFFRVAGLAWDGTDIYACDVDNHRIRKITTGGVVTTFAGSGAAGSTDGIGVAAQFNRPHGITFAGGFLYVAGYFGNNIRRIDIATANVLIIAGSAAGTSGFVDGIGTAARFSQPTSIVHDGVNTLYVAESGNHTVRAIQLGTNSVSTFVGTNTANFVDGTNTAARLSSPIGVLYDATGYLYVMDQSNHAIRRVTFSAPTVSSFAPTSAYPMQVVTITGTNFTGATQVQFGGVNAAWYNVDSPTQIRAVVPFGAAAGNVSVTTVGGTGNLAGFTVAVTPQVSTLAGDGTASFLDAAGQAAQFNNPYGIAIDAGGNIYESDRNNHRIRKTTPAGVVTTLAGSGVAGWNDATGTAAQFNQPAGLAVDAGGNVYVADAQNHRIRKITPGGVVTTLAGSGAPGFADATGAAAQFNAPYGVVVDGAGNVYVGDGNNHRIRRITSVGVVTTFAGSGAPGFADATGVAAQFNAPTFVALDGSGNLYVGDEQNHRIRKITSAGVVTTLAGSSAGFADGTGAAAQFNQPYGVAVDASGNVYVADFGNHRIRYITPGGAVSTIVGGAPGFADGLYATAQFNNPHSIAIDGAGNIYVGDYNNHRIRKIAPAPPTVSSFATAPFTAGTGYPGLGVVINGTNFIGVTQVQFGGVASPSFNVISATQLVAAVPSGGASGNVSVTNSVGTGSLAGFTFTGTVPQVSTVVGNAAGAGFADGQNGAARLNVPWGGIKIGGDIYFTEYSGHRVRKYNIATGNVTTLAGSGVAGYLDATGTMAQFNNPQGLTRDAAGDLYVADGGNHRIRKIAVATGVVTTFAGSGVAGWNDATGTLAQFDNPAGLEWDGTYIYVCDVNNNRIRRIQISSAVVTTFAGSGAAGNADGVGTGAQFNFPVGITCDGTTFLYVAGYYGNNIRRISLASANVVTVAGSAAGTAGFTDGVGTAARLNYPTGIAWVNGGIGGLLYVADLNNQSIRLIDIGMSFTVNTYSATNIAGNVDGTLLGARYNSPSGIVYDASGVFYVFDQNNHAIRRVSPAPPTVTSFTPTSAYPMQVVTVNGTTLSGASQVQFGGVNAAWYNVVSATQIQAVVPFGAMNGSVSVTTPAGTASLAGFTVAVTPQVSTFAGDGAGGSLDAAGQAIKMSQAIGIVFSSIGDMYIAEVGNNVIRKITPQGISTIIAGNGSAGFANGTGAAAQFNGPHYMTIDPGTGDLYVADYNNHRIRKITSGGVVSTLAGTGVAGFMDGAGVSAQFNSPIGIVYYAGFVYVSEDSGHRIRKIDASTGLVSTLAGNGSSGYLDATGTSAQLSSPRGMTIGLDGNIYVAEPSNQCIRKVTLPGGVVTTFAGLGTAPGYVDGVGANARFSNPRAITSDANGNFYVSDVGNNRIRMISPCGAVSTLAGGMNTGNNDGGLASDMTIHFDSEGLVCNSAGVLFVATRTAQTIRRIEFPIYQYVSGDAGVASSWRLFPGLVTPASNFTTVGSQFSIAPGALATANTGFALGAGVNMLIRDNATLNLNGVTMTNGGIVSIADGATGGRVILTGTGGVAASSVCYAGANSTLESAGGVAKTLNISELASPMPGKVVITNTFGTSIPSIVMMGATGTVAVNTGARLIIPNTFTLTNNNPSGTSFTVQNGGTLEINGTGQVAVGSASAVNYVVGSTLEYSGGMGKSTNAQEFPATMNGNVLISNTGTVTLDAAKTLGASATLTIAGSGARLRVPTGVSITNNNASTSFTVQSGGTLEIQDNGQVTGSSDVSYAIGSTLEYSGTVAKTTTAREIGAAGVQNLLVSNMQPVTLGANATVVQSLTVNDGSKLVLSNAGNPTLTLNNTLNLNTTGLLSSANGANAGSLILSGAGAAVLRFEAANNTLNNFMLNRSGSHTLPNDVNVLGTLTFMNGVLVPNVRVFSGDPAGTAAGIIAGGNTSSYVQGKLQRRFAGGIVAAGTSYDFPVGTATLNTYKPATLVNVLTGASPVVQVENFDTGASTYDATLTALFSPRNWQVQLISGVFNGSAIALTDAGTNAGNVVARSTAQIGTYTGFGGSIVGQTITSSPSSVPANPMMLNHYFALGSVQPFISMVSPSTVSPGDTVTITGNQLGSVSAISFGGTPAASFQVISQTQIRAVVGSGSSGPITLIYPGGTAPSMQTTTFMNAPVITSFDPTYGTTGSTVRITGQRLSNPTNVSFGGTNGLSLRSIDANTLDATVGLGASGPVSVQTQSGSATSGSNFDFIVKPSIVNFFPKWGRIADTVNIYGGNFQRVSSVRFGTSAPILNFTLVTSGQIRLRVPSDVATGMIRTTNPVGTDSSWTDFIYTAPPRLQSVFPNPIIPVGQAITLTGGEFHPVPRVMIGTTTAASVQWTDLTQIKATFAQATTGILTIYASGGNVSLATPVQVVLPPVISSFAPRYPSPGDRVTVTGANFFAGFISLSIGGVPVSGLAIQSSTQLTFTVPPTVAGPLTITTPGGLSVVATGQTVNVVPQPQITGSSGITTATIGQSLILQGTGLMNIVAFTLGGVDVTNFAEIGTTGTVLQMTIPRIPGVDSAAAEVITTEATIALLTRSGSAFYTFFVRNHNVSGTTGTSTNGTTPGGGGTSTLMRITSVSPVSLPEGSSVTLQGVNIATNATVWAGSGVNSQSTNLRRLNIESQSTTSMVVLIPDGFVPPLLLSTGATLIVSTPTYQIPSPFAVQVLARAIPSFATFFPEQGSTRAIVSIVGENFAASNAEERGAVRSVSIGGIPVQAFRVVSPSLIQATVGSVQTGFVRVVTASGMLQSQTVFTLDTSAAANAEPPEPVVSKDSLALNRFFAATGGMTWTTSTNWANAAPIALRFGVKVRGGRVVELRLPNIGVQGTLVPDVFADLDALEVLDVSGNRMSGVLPQEFALLLNLKTLRLQGNRFTGALPQGFCGMGALSEVDLSGNSLRDSLANLCCLSHVETLNLNGNSFVGTIPVCIQNMTALSTLDLEGNGIGGTVPDAVGRLRSLRVVNLRSNRFTGAFPRALGQSFNNAVAASGNSLSSNGATTPKANNSAVVHEALGLETLDLGGNGFTGEIPDEIGNFPNARTIRLDGNNFAGSLPKTLLSLTRLRVLDVSNNQLTGGPDLNLIPRLDTLRVENNRFAVVALERFWGVKNYTYLPQEFPSVSMIANSVSISTSTTLTITVNESLLLQVPRTENFSRTTWRKNGVVIATPLDTSRHADLRIPAFALSDAGVYECVITNDRLEGVVLTTAQVRVTGQLPQVAPLLVALQEPRTNEEDVPTEPRFVWTSSTSAETYRLQLAADADFAQVLASTTIPQSAEILALGTVSATKQSFPNQFAGNFPLQNDRRYYWRVRAENGVGTSAWATGTFTTVPPDAVLTISALDMGRTARFDSVGGSITIRNFGTSPLSLESVRAENAVFMLEDVRTGTALPVNGELRLLTFTKAQTVGSTTSAITVRFRSGMSSTVQARTMQNRLAVRVQAVKLVAPALDTVIAGRRQLNSIQVLNLSDELVTLRSAALQQLVTAYSLRPVERDLEIPAGQSTTLLLETTAKQTGVVPEETLRCITIRGADVATSNRNHYDTVQTHFRAVAREARKEDVFIKVSIKAVEDSIAPGGSVTLELALSLLPGSSFQQIVRSATPSFKGTLRWNPQVLALATGERGLRALPMPTTKPEASNQATSNLQQFTIPQNFWSGLTPMLLQVKAVAVAGNTDVTPLVLENLEWGGGVGTVYIDALENGIFTAKACLAGGKRLVTSAKPTQLAVIAPNPAKEQVSVSYTLREDGFTEIALIDANGKTAQILVAEEQAAGEYNITRGLKGLPSGAYTMRLTTRSGVVSRGLNVVR